MEDIKYIEILIYSEKHSTYIDIKKKQEQIRIVLTFSCVLQYPRGHVLASAPRPTDWYWKKYFFQM